MPLTLLSDGYFQIKMASWLKNGLLRYYAKDRLKADLLGASRWWLTGGYRGASTRCHRSGVEYLSRDPPLASLHRRRPSMRPISKSWKAAVLDAFQFAGFASVGNKDQTDMN